MHSNILRRICIVAAVLCGYTLNVMAQTPAAPTLLTPANGATGQAVTPKLTWNTAATATSYRVQVSTISTFATTVVDDSTLTVATDSLTTALSYGTVYYWRVNANNASGSSAWSNIRNFTTLTQTPGTPTLITPANRATGIAVTPKLTWNTVNATSYRVQVSTISTFATTVVDDSTLTVAKDSLTTALSYGTVYYWRVNGKNSYGSGSWSAINSFTTLTQTPGTPMLITPANRATGIAVTPKLTWNTVNATSYRVQVSTTSTFATTIVDDSTLTVATDSLTTALSYGTVYYWRVNGKNSYGSGSWSNISSFTTLTQTPGTPTLITPANRATGIAVTPKLTWNTVNATSYRVQVSTISTFATTVVDDSTLTVATDSLTTALSYGTVYYWRVNGKNSYGSGSWSAINSFTTLTQTPGTPMLITPANRATGIALTPKLTWNTVNATSYRVQVSTISTFATTILDDSTLTVATDSMTTALSYGTVYYWRANGKNSYGTGPWSNINSFTTMTQMPAAPTLVTPANRATGIALTPKLTWNTVNATSYRVQVSTISTFATTVLDDSTLTVATDSLTTALSYVTVYYWRVNGKNSYGTGSWSNINSFTTMTQTPAAPTLLTPANGDTTTAVYPKLTWNSISNAASYRVQVSTISTFATTVVDDSTLTVASDSLITALSYSTVYYWRVNSKNTYGTSVWSLIRNFKTASHISTGICLDNMRHYSGIAAFHGTLELYRANGVRILTYTSGSTATKDQMLKTAAKGLAKGCYFYKLKTESNVLSSGSVIIR